MSLELTEGQTFGPRTIKVTRTTLVRYAGASGDFNPIHYSDCAAREAGMDGVIAHGMWTMGATLGAVIDWVGGPERVISQRARFTRPVQVPDTKEGAAIEVAAMVRKVSDEAATLAVDVKCNGQSVLGRVEVGVRRGE
ncbi:dehydratase [Propionibacterium sp. NM47_B9-13]|uniref:MaoC family dehydratase n=2 Tax=Cutibacterium modestum TaxID=2559073 RepID=A0AAD1KQ38_9ACTN|nr:MaoC family dehydratase [Cutibacterium modestum]MCP2376830.1 MaoC family protein [Cutibacterium modestum 28N]MCP2380298.1 MaoC family protein [Cutibacterium modestum 30N]TGY29969.1 dehydratase [Propionibacterium sp. NM47_B9-13]AOH46012.1 dehydratase [Cutibacterium modestum]EFS73704.1 MaoC-like protein [Cutibacterium modestum HL037PA2]